MIVDIKYLMMNWVVER